ncbi:MAG TPA: ABC transporter permease [Candidatus Acidoferrum sp.]|jgi:putative ABC transport system permease protein
MHNVWQDLKYAARMLRKNVGFTAVAVITLGLGIGANTAIFSVVNAVLLRPLPYPDADRLVYISQTIVQSQTPGVPVSFTKFEQIQQQSQTLESSAAFFGQTLSFVTQREPEAVTGALATVDFFKVLGVAPAHGRTFVPEEERHGGGDVAVISDGFWHSHFGGDETILGSAITLDGKDVTVVGILPPTFRFPLQFPEPDVWLPRVDEVPSIKPEQVRSGAGYLGVIARLRPGSSLPQAEAELKTIDARYRAQFGSYVDATKFTLAATSLKDNLVAGLRPSLLVLLAAIGFVLLIACANVANLLMARATAREKEIAIRKALGASKARLVAQLLMESLLLSFAGGIVGLLLSELLLPALRTLQPGAFPRVQEAGLDARVLLFTLLLCVVTGIVFGIVPSLQAAESGLQSSLKEGGRGSSEGVTGGRLRSLLIVGEIAVALILMTGAGLLIESFAKLMHVNPGFVSRNVTTFPLSLPPNRYPDAQRQAQFYRQLVEKIKNLPGVESAGATSFLPLSGAARIIFFCPEGRACEGIGKDPTIALRQVTPGYFDTTRTPLIRGRVFTANDAANGALVAIVNETTARRYWPGQDALGKRVANSRDKIQRQIVGIVGDVKYTALNNANSEEMYLPMEQNPWPAATLLVRSQGNTQALVGAVRAAVAEIDPALPVTGVLSMDDVIAASVAQPRLIMQFVGVFAGFALLLAGVGIYGVMAYSVNQRKQELGIRLALGASRADIFRLVVGRGMLLTACGVVVGVLASLALTRLLSTLLFGVRAMDVGVFSAAALVLAGAAFLACLVPARRATRVDPIVGLRYE